MKKIISVILILVTLFTLACPAYAAEARLVDSNLGTVTFTISSSGSATIVVRLSGSSTLSSASMHTYIEKKVANIWTRVSVNSSYSGWEYTTTSTSVTKTYSAQLSSTGEYRAVTVFTLTGTTVEEVTQMSTATYS